MDVLVIPVFGPLARHNFSSRYRVCDPEGEELPAVTRTRRLQTKDKTEDESETP
jgi:hypothetical protein